MSNVVETIFRGVDEIGSTVSSISTKLSSLDHMAHSAGESLSALFEAGAIVEFAKKLQEATDYMTEMNNLLSQFRSTQEDVVRTQNHLSEIAIETGVAYKDTFEVYARLLAQSDRLGLSESNRLEIVKTINELHRLGGPLAGNVAAQIQRALVTGRLEGRSMVTLFSNAPALMDAVMERMGAKTSTELRRMAQDGRISINVLLDALQSSAGKIEESFSKTKDTVGEGVTAFSTAFFTLANSVDRALGQTKYLSKLLTDGAKILNDMAKPETASDRANSVLIANSKELNDLLERQVMLNQKIAENGGDASKMLKLQHNPDPNALPQFLGGQPRVSQSLGDWLKETKDRIDALRPKVAELQTAFKETKGAEAAADAIHHVAEEEDLLAGKAGSAVKSLQDQAATLGFTARQVKMYELTVAGATDKQIKAAMAAYDSIDAYKRLQESLSHAGEVLEVLPEGIEGPVKEVEVGLEEMTNMSEVAWQTMGKTAQEHATKAGIAWDNAVKGIQEVLVDNLVNGFQDGLKGMLKAFIDVIRRMIAEALAAKLVEKLFGTSEQRQNQSANQGVLGSVIGGFLGMLGSPKAAGGWTTPFMLHPVNEQGPEFLMSPDRSRVVPLGKMSANGIGMGGVVYAPVNHNTYTSTVNPAELEMLMRRRDAANLAAFQQLGKDGLLT